MNIADLRIDYKKASLSEGDVDANPLLQFDRWLNEAIKAQIPEPTAMSLATVAPDAQGAPRPSSRIVLLKGRDEAGFVFFTNYESRKGREMQADPYASLLFHWVELERQVRIEGVIEKVSGAESDAYFASRPLASRQGAVASPQSAVIESREWLEHRFSETAKQYPGDPPRPDHWGGYRLKPDFIEFWQGRRSRLHDRLRYRRDNENWVIERLAP
jgi:pyridoxamine 5'-phosphate oxidase